MLHSHIKNSILFFFNHSIAPSKQTSFWYFNAALCPIENTRDRRKRIIVILRSSWGDHNVFIPTKEIVYWCVCDGRWWKCKVVYITRFSMCARPQSTFKYLKTRNNIVVQDTYRIPTILLYYIKFFPGLCDVWNKN